MEFKDLKLELKTTDVKFLFGDKEVLVKQYLPVRDKHAIVIMATTGAQVENVISRVLMDAYLHLLIVENYTNIEFTEDEKENILGVFDLLQTNGLIDLVIENMPQAEYEYLFNEASIHANNLNEYYRSFGYTLQTLDSVQEFLRDSNLDNLLGDTPDSLNLDLGQKE